MIEINEGNYEQEVTKSEKPVLLMFYRESGCSNCAHMKPIFEEYEKANPEIKCVRYKLGKPDGVTQKFQFKVVPAFFAFIEGKPVGGQEGIVSMEDLHLTFTPELIKPKHVPIEKASLQQLMTDELALIDQIASLRKHLKKVQKEISERKQWAMGDLSNKEPCCGSCSENKT